MDDRQGVEALRLVRPQTAVPVHHEDYTVFKSSLDAFRRRAATADLATRLVYLAPGDTHSFRLA
jgi:hypothetical protein